MRLILASRSPRRAELLRQMRLAFEVQAADVDESPRSGEAPEEYVVRLAQAKAGAAYAGAVPRAPDEAAAASRPRAELLVLGADTTVVLDGRMLAKPAGVEDGVAMLLALSGRCHQVLTGIAVHGAHGVRTGCVRTDVTFRPIERWEAAAYWATGEGADKAGGYGIQGVGGIFATSISGSYSAVVGLPVAETERLLRESGLDTWRERIHA